ncbi:MAG: hypothetical protein LCH91_17125 [Bacteroidetes bacterium]|nr:hypothetical protein [Bacteroidota bacterium]
MPTLYIIAGPNGAGNDYTEGHPLRIAERLPQGDKIVENSELWLKINNNENS